MIVLFYFFRRCRRRRRCPVHVKEPMNKRYRFICSHAFLWFESLDSEIESCIYGLQYVLTAHV